ncbi:MAG: phosphomannomutase, partial [Proteobacteria bacterium]|nr:phosphomannomutase [Pseudomonadota bacterium]
MNPEIFREYDIRGIAGKDMTDQEVFVLGKGIGTYLKRKGCSKLNVGRDCRVTSEPYAREIIQGLRASG